MHAQLHNSSLYFIWTKVLVNISLQHTHTFSFSCLSLSLSLAHTHKKEMTLESFDILQDPGAEGEYLAGRASRDTDCSLRNCDLVEPENQKHLPRYVFVHEKP